MIPHDQHPARHAPIIAQRRLAGMHKEGVPAADVEVARGADGGWYSRWSFHIPSTGSATPITHSPAFASEQEAIDDRLQLILAKARKIAAMPAHNYSDTDRQCCRRIEAWAIEQLGPQQMGLGL